MYSWANRDVTVNTVVGDIVYGIYAVTMMNLIVNQGAYTTYYVDFVGQMADFLQTFVYAFADGEVHTAFEMEYACFHAQKVVAL